MQQPYCSKCKKDHAYELNCDGTKIFFGDISDALGQVGRPEHLSVYDIRFVRDRLYNPIDHWTPAFEDSDFYDIDYTLYLSDDRVPDAHNNHTREWCYGYYDGIYYIPYHDTEYQEEGKGVPHEVAAALASDEGIATFRYMRDSEGMWLWKD